MRKAINVTTLNLLAKEILQSSELMDVVVQGEITGFTRHYKSGHCYFTLRDTRSSIKAVMFARQAGLLGFRPEDGMEVYAYGNAAIYERDGVFQLYVDYMRPSGIGSTQKAFDQLKAKLEKEGLFDPRNKKPLPAMPKTIGVVTSKTGAALQDILNILSRRWPMVKLLLAPVNVQGITAEKEIAGAIHALDSDGRSDIILVSRGGGSREDLWVFNSETIARAAFACKTPLVSAVGHEIDYTILDYVADLRAPTPSAAAELCVPDREEWLEKLAVFAKNMQNHVQFSLNMCYNKLNNLSPEERLAEYRFGLTEKRLKLQETAQMLSSAAFSRIESGEKRLAQDAALAVSYSPYGVLARGYAMIEGGKVVEQLSPGDKITLRGASATAACTVDQVKQKENTHETA